MLDLLAWTAWMVAMFAATTFTVDDPPRFRSVATVVMSEALETTAFMLEVFPATVSMFALFPATILMVDERPRSRSVATVSMLVLFALTALMLDVLFATWSMFVLLPATMSILALFACTALIFASFAWTALMRISLFATATTLTMLEPTAFTSAIEAATVSMLVLLAATFWIFDVSGSAISVRTATMPGSLYMLRTEFSAANACDRFCSMSEVRIGMMLPEPSKPSSMFRRARYDGICSTLTGSDIGILTVRSSFSFSSCIMAAAMSRLFSNTSASSTSPLR